MNKPQIGLALGAGSARGLAHIGVLKVLKENCIGIDYIAGTSAGALIGALFCSDADMNGIVNILKYINRKHIIDFSVSKKGFIQGKKIEELLKLFIKVKRFEELKIPFAVVATDLIKGEKVVINSGDIVKAVRASISIPGVFTPVYDGDRILVDGAIMDRVPVDVVKEMGADIVIGVDVGYKPGDDYVPQNIMDIIIQTMGIMEMQLLKYRTKKCDRLICPQVNHLKPYSLDNADECIKGGIDAAEKNIDKIKDLIKNYNNEVFVKSSNY